MCGGAVKKVVQSVLDITTAPFKEVGKAAGIIKDKPAPVAAAEASGGGSTSTASGRPDVQEKGAQDSGGSPEEKRKRLKGGRKSLLIDTSVGAAAATATGVGVPK